MDVRIKDRSAYSLILALSILFLLQVRPAGADTVYLKDGRVVEGIVSSEEGPTVRLDFEFGSIDFPKGEIDRIRRSDRREREILKGRLEKNRSAAEAVRERESTVKEQKPRTRDGRERVQHIAVSATLNRKVPVKLLLDTGASYVIVSNRIGRQLGVDLTGDRDTIQLQIGDGRRIAARYVTLRSVNVEGVEATDVGGAVLLDDQDKILSFDGVLGMSFLSRFNFKVDHQSKKLMFEEVSQAPAKAPEAPR